MSGETDRAAAQVRATIGHLAQMRAMLDVQGRQLAFADTAEGMLNYAVSTLTAAGRMVADRFIGPVGTILQQVDELSGAQTVLRDTVERLSATVITMEQELADVERSLKGES